MDEQPKSRWDGFEITKLAATALLFPIAIAIVGYFIHAQLATQTHNYQNEQRILDRRFNIYDEIRVPINRIYCFVMDVGTFRENNPDTIIKYKRTVDQAMYTAQALRNKDTFKAYTDYMASAFAEREGYAGQNAKIRTAAGEKLAANPNWPEMWTQALTGTRDPAQEDKYQLLNDLIARDLITLRPR